MRQLLLRFLLEAKTVQSTINYYILETDADGNILDLDVFEYEVTGEGTVALSKDNLAGNINLVNKIPEDTDGKLRVQKTDGNGVGLAGASFRLTDEDGSAIDERTSEASAHELELEPGTYTTDRGSGSDRIYRCRKCNDQS